MGTDYKHCGCRYEDPRQEELSHLSFEWTKRQVSAETKRYLAALPFRVDIRPAGGHASNPTIILVRGTPTLNTVYWTENRPDSFCLQMARIAGARAGDVICFGHTHRPWLWSSSLVAPKVHKAEAHELARSIANALFGEVRLPELLLPLWTWRPGNGCRYL